MPHLAVPLGWTLSEWQQAYRDERMGPEVLVALRDTLQAADPAWISLASRKQLDDQLQGLARLRAGVAELGALPLYGVPFAIKDNIDAAGWRTTAACPAFAYEAREDATVVQRLRTAGAILIGKTNLDQFATGLVGTRSPFGAVPNTFDARYVSGGSSAGSASVVARGLVPFALGTDTAGSGRIPAGFNNIVGLKPTRGWLPTTGVVPACRTLDCVSIFALTAQDAAVVTSIAAGPDAIDPYSRRHPGTAPVALPERPRFGIPTQLEFHGDDVMARAFDQTLGQLREMGAELLPFDFAACTELAALLYQGPWVTERAIAVGELLRSNPQALDPIVRELLGSARQYSAEDAFRAEYRRAALAARINSQLQEVDALLVPTSPTIRTGEEIALHPVTYNSQFGIYTNFANLADLCAIAVPATLRADALPAGITLLAPAWHDAALAQFAARWQATLTLTLGATGRTLQDRPAGILPQAAAVRVAVVGAHLRGMPLNHQLTTRGAVFVEATRTAAAYRLFSLPDSHPPKPALARSETGAAIKVELWDIPTARFGEFVAEIPPPLGMGTLRLEDGRQVKGFICEAGALHGATDITASGGWREFLAQRRASQQ